MDGFRGAPIGGFAYVKKDGTPNAVPVTPFVADDRIVITSTLAYVTKAAAVRRDPRVALLAGGSHVASTGSVVVDETPTWFNRNIRDDEITKFPPTWHFLGIPFHECLFPWYSGHVLIDFEPATIEPAQGGDRVTVASLDHEGRLLITPLAAEVTEATDDITTSGVTDGPAVVLVHEEHDDMADLRQLALAGMVRRGVFTVSSRRGSLAPTPTGTRAQLPAIRSMAKLARANRGLVSDWPHLQASEGHRRSPFGPITRRDPKSISTGPPKWRTTSLGATTTTEDWSGTRPFELGMRARRCGGADQEQHHRDTATHPTDKVLQQA
jgi:hypothetical protein